MSTESSITSSSSFAPSWLRPANHSPTPPFRASGNPVSKERSELDWDQRKNLNGFHQHIQPQWHNDHHNNNVNENYSGNNHHRISDFNRDLFRRSNSLSSNHQRPPNNLLGDSHRHYHPGRSKFDTHFRSQVGFKPFAKDNHQHNGTNGFSYSSVATKNIKAPTVPNDPVLQQSDFPSLVPMKAEPVKTGQNGIWVNPPHARPSTSRVAKVLDRTFSSQGYENGSGLSGTILGPHYGKGFLMTRDNKDDSTSQLNGFHNGSSDNEYAKTDHAESAVNGEEDQQKSEDDIDSNHQELEEHSGSEEEEEPSNWPTDDVLRSHPEEEEEVDRGGKPSMLSSTGSTGSVDSIDSHQSHLSGSTAMMVEDLLDDTISEEEKMAIMHALEEIKERTGYGSYYERVALTENRHRNYRYPLQSDGKSEDDDEDPDDRFLK